MFVHAKQRCLSQCFSHWVGGKSLLVSFFVLGSSWFHWLQMKLSAGRPDKPVWLLGTKNTCPTRHYSKGVDALWAHPANLQDAAGLCQFFIGLFFLICWFPPKSQKVSNDTTPEAIKQLHLCGTKIEKTPKPKRDRARDDTSGKFPSQTCPPGNKQKKTSSVHPARLSVKNQFQF